MQITSHDFFTRAGLTGDQYADFSIGNLSHHMTHPLDRVTAPDQAAKHVVVPNPAKVT